MTPDEWVYQKVSLVKYHETYKLNRNGNKLILYQCLQTAYRSEEKFMGLIQIFLKVVESPQQGKAGILFLL